MKTKDNLKFKSLITVVIIIFIFLMFFFFFLNSKINNLSKKSDEGYDYCIEWSDYINRDNLIYTCYNLVKQEFLCDYDINRNTQVLMFLPIINLTKDEEGGIIEIVYDDPRYHNCTKWLKSR